MPLLFPKRGLSCLTQIPSLTSEKRICFATYYLFADAWIGVPVTKFRNTSIYYKGTPISDEELACKEIIDHLHTDNPAWGARQMSAQLKARGYHVGRRKARRYMNEMDIYPIYPKMNLSKRMQQAKVCPYLLRNAVIDKPNQARSIDITYIPIKRGFLYLTAVIDWHSRWADIS